MRLNPEQRTRMIAQAALKVAKGPTGLTGVTHGAVAKRCPILTSASTVKRYFGTQALLQLACVELEPEFRGVAIEIGIITE